MDTKEALRQELACWLDFAQDERLESLSHREDLAKAGISYLLDLVQQVWQPLSEEEKLTATMAIYLNQQSYLRK